MSAEAPLVRLLASAPGVAGVCGPDDRPPAYDAHVSLIDLAGACCGVTPRRRFRRPCPTLPPIRRGARGRASCSPRYAGVRKIGIAWSGSRANTLNRRRSIPLAALARAVRIARHRVVLAAAEHRRRGDCRRSGSAGACTACRREKISTEWRRWLRSSTSSISVDTSIVHLARRARTADVGDARVRRPTGGGIRATTDSPWYPTAAPVPPASRWRLGRRDPRRDRRTRRILTVSA